MKHKTGDFLKDNDWIFALLFLIIVSTLIAGVIATEIVNETRRITEGTIIDKKFVAEQICYNGIYYRSPERHMFLLRGTKNGKTVEYWCEVSAEDYSQYRTGDYYRE